MVSQGHNRKHNDNREIAHMNTTLMTMAKLIGTPLLGAGLVLGGAFVTAAPAAASTSSVVGSDSRPPAPDTLDLQRIDDREPGYYPTSPARDPGYYPTSPAHQSVGNGSESQQPSGRGSARH